MNLFPERAHWEYSFCKNAEMLKDEGLQHHERRFDSENLCSTFPGASQMPFMETAFLAIDFDESRKSFGRKFAAVRNGWPVLEKLLVHEDRGSIDLFCKAARKAGMRNMVRSRAEMTAELVRGLERFGSEFYLDAGAASKRIKDLISQTKGKASLTTALSHYRTDGRLDSLWTQLSSIRAAWSKVYFMIAPIYWWFNWDPAKVSLDDYTLSQKRFVELRPFYIDCFETFCRLSVVAAAFEGIAKLDQFVIPFPSSAKSVSDLEAMANGSKHTILNQIAVGDLFVPFIDSKLRNGVGHNDARYDVTLDAITYRNHSPARGIEEFYISYVRFCEKMAALYGQLESVAPVVHFLRLIDREKP